ncbi:MAG: helix-turn-helix domain-containing protein [Planctomycetes bacterium]|nr:helix-turn-helix domain-containing protein [Planctomycetota bacterium]
MARARTLHRHPPTTPEVMTISDLAAYLQMSQSSLYKLVQRGSVPGHKVGRHWRFHKVSIDKWLQESSIKPSHPPKK